ncbi:MAG: class I SAM-dependent methyltransferase [Phycisphaerales bacterium]
MTPDSDSYLKPYEQALRRFGPGFETTLWSNRRSQVARFAALNEVVDLEDKRLLDAGCGEGDLAEWLDSAGVPYRAYIGLEGLDALVRKANERGLPRSEFHTADFVSDPQALRIGRPDIIFFSGSLNTLREDDARRVVEYAYDAAVECVAFNFLSDRCPPARRNEDTGPATRFDTLAWIKWALDRTHRVAFHQEYLDGHDAMIVMWRANGD